MVHQLLGGVPPCPKGNPDCPRTNAIILVLQAKKQESETIFKENAQLGERLQMAEKELTLMAQRLELAEEKTKRAEAKASEWENTSLTDQLTKLKSKFMFTVTLQTEFAKMIRNDTELSLILFDLDGFKQINDVHGHLAGDKVLETVGKIMNARIHRATDIAARYGGDEFAILLPETPLEAACDKAKEILSYLRALDLQSKIGIPGKISGSFGVAAINRTMIEANLVFDQNCLITGADKMLYIAKKEGGDRVCCPTTHEEDAGMPKGGSGAIRMPEK